MDTATLTEKIEALANVASTNLWEKGNHSRLYITVKSQNNKPAGSGATIYIDLNTGEVHATLDKKHCSGAKTYAWAQEVLSAVQNILATLESDNANVDNSNELSNEEGEKMDTTTKEQDMKRQDALGTIVKKQAHRKISEWLQEWDLEARIAEALAQHLLDEVLKERKTSAHALFTDAQTIEQLVMVAQQAAAALDEADQLMPLIDKLADAIA